MSRDVIPSHVDGTGIDRVQRRKHLFSLWLNKSMGIEPVASQHKEVIVVHPGE
jgi:hypothetical protein